MTSPRLGRSNESEMHLATAVSDLLARGWTTAIPYPDMTGLGRAALDAARYIFALPAERKAMFVDPSGHGNIGWRPTSRGDRPNEVWQLGGGEADLWPAELEADRAAVHRLRTRCVEIAVDLMEALIPALGLPASELSGCVSVVDSVARLLHYDRRSNGIGFAPHTDLGLATFFAAESIPSLELEDEAGQWRPVEAGRAVAAGEMLFVRTSGRVRAGRHRIRSPLQERLAVAVFVHPEPAYPLGIDDDGQTVTAWSFFQRALSVYTAEARPKGGDRT